ncbi:MAG: oxidative damage protection protein [Methylococcaceae bacterium]
MTRTVLCSRYGIEAQGLERPPFPGAVGQRIYEQVSQKAWEEWVRMQTILINEHRLTPFEPKARQFLAGEREKFLFGGEVSVPEAYKPLEG